VNAILAGVIGWPVSHSQSPALHGFWLREHGIDGSYVALPIRRSDLSLALAGLRSAGFTGVNLTLPHKEAAFALAHTADPAAHATQAANLLLFENTKMHARNTDVEGFVQSIRETQGDRTVPFRRVTVVGAGGAARAVILGSDQLGAREIYVLNRTKAHAHTLVHALSGSVKGKLSAAGLEAWDSVAPETDLLVNATSAGLNGTPPPDTSLDLLPEDAAVCDLVYVPLETELLAKARARRLMSIDGLGMLMHQGALAFELLFGTRPNVSATLRTYLEQVLSREK
jgi:shikimate dehydrogenase